MTKEQARKRLSQIGKLKYDWNGYKAQPFQSRLIKKCKKILQGLYPVPNIYPTGRRSIQFEYEKEDKSYLEFEIYIDKTHYLEVTCRNYDSAISEEIRENEKERIHQLTKEFFSK